MYILINLFIFVLVLFLYIHIHFHISTSNYLEVYEIENVTKDKFEDICNFKQPVLVNNISIINNLTIDSIKSSYSSFDIKIYNVQSDNRPSNQTISSADSNTNMFVLMQYSNALELFGKDPSGSYISEYNKDFLEETSLIKEFSSQDMFLRPYNISYIDYDLLLGSNQAYTQLKYTLNNRNYLTVLNGSVEISLCPPKYYKYLHIDIDYELMEVKSNIDIYNIDDIYTNDYNKVKFMKIKLSSHQLLQIPPYWFYCIKILEQDTLIAKFNYRTYINSISILPQICMKHLQNNNVKNNVTKIMDL